jgi:hypothetical protein
MADAYHETAVAWILKFRQRMAHQIKNAGMIFGLIIIASSGKLLVWHFHYYSQS